MLLGNEETVQAFKAWLKQWTLKKKPSKAFLLVGPPGVGKTTLARAGANDFQFRVVEMNASDIRTEKTIQHLLLPARTSTLLDSYSTNMRANLILMDEVDGVFGREDRGGLGAILSIIKNSPVPIVLTANNVDDEKFDDLKKTCIVTELTALRQSHANRETAVKMIVQEFKEMLLRRKQRSTRREERKATRKAYPKHRPIRAH
jgi:replication factor C large subunit